MPCISDDKTVPEKPLKWYKKLATKKGRREAGAFLVEGERAVSQIITDHPDHIIEVLATEKRGSPYPKHPTRFLTESQFHSISFTKTPQGSMAVVRTPPQVYSAHVPEHVGTHILLLEDIQDPGNVGTLIRTAVAFNFSGVILTEKCADPFSPKSVQSTAGTVLSVWIRRTAQYLEIAEALKKRDHFLVAADLNGTVDPSILGHQKNLLLALGNEASGLSPALLSAADYRLKIPIFQKKVDSLNVAACGAICMYLSCRKS